MRALVSGLFAMLLGLWPALAAAQQQYIFFEKSPGSFPLVAGSKTATFYASETDWPGVLRTVRDVQADIQRVSGREPAFLTDAPLPGRLPVVLVGTLGHSPLIDGLVQRGKLDVANLAGRWETFVVQALDHPMPGIEQALVLAGSDQRGTIYGLYDLARQVGVSPWYWWANAPIIPHKNLYVSAGRHTLGQPTVKYRGLSSADFPASSLAAADYERLLELLLRLRANYLSPATKPADAALATSYGLLPTVPAAGLTVALHTRADEPSPLPRLRQQLRQAPAGPARCWLLRAADLRPVTYPVSVFFDYPWMDGR